MTRDFATLTPAGGSRSRGELVTTVAALLADLGERRETVPPDELARARTAERAMKAAIHAERQLADLYGRIAQLEQLALTDELTGVFNRRGIEMEIGRALASARRHAERGVPVYADLDRFKVINDRHGHAAGDAVLCQVAHRLRDAVRQTDAVGRLGSDEFCVLLTRTTPRAAARRLTALREMLNPSTVSWQGLTLTVGASLGIEAYDGHVTDAALLLGRADAAMYAAKRQRAGDRPAPSPVLAGIEASFVGAPLASTT